MSVHLAVAAIFLAFGFCLGLWGGASGGILARASVDAASFGVMLTVYTGAYLVAMSSGGALAWRFGVRLTLTGSGLLLAGAFFALLNAEEAATVASLLILVGFLAGVVDVTMNAEGARIERALGRPILARLHAAASAGMAAGAILGSLIVSGATPWAAGALAAFVLILAGIAYDRAARSEGEAARINPAAGRRGLSFAPALIALGVVIGLSIAAETAASLWSALLLRTEAPSLAAVAGLGTAFFAGCQAILRFNADLVRLRVSDQRIIVASFGIAAAGFALVAARGGFAISVTGFALIGVGTGSIVPCAFALAAAQSPGEPALGLSSASMFSAATRLPAPFLTGAIAQSLSLPVAFGAFAVALILAAGGAALGPRLRGARAARRA